VSLLTLSSVTVQFGGLRAVDGVSFDIQEGEAIGLIGPNGAGKTTVLNVITRLQNVSAGRVTFRGTNLLARRPDEVAAQGLARTFQGIELFSRVRVLDNVLAGMHSAQRSNLLAAMVRSPVYRREEAERQRVAMALLERLGLERLAQARAGDLSYGQQRLLDLARALAARPRLLLLDEPASGFAAKEVESLRELLRDLWRELGLTLIVVEHVMPMVMALCERIVVLNHGRKIAEGTPDEVQANREVIDAYLGSHDAATPGAV
jgi:ABC-type branched-subunit amino acid transport system ATPase component